MEDTRLELFIGGPYDGEHLAVNKARYIIDGTCWPYPESPKAHVYHRRILEIDGKQLIFFTTAEISLTQAIEILMGNYRGMAKD